MARPPKEQKATSNSLVASAARYAGSGVGTFETLYTSIEEWQKEAWRQYDICPELRFAAGWIGNALSRCSLSPGEVNELGQIVSKDDPTAAAALTALFAGSSGQSQMLRSLGIHLTVAGCAYIVGRAAKLDIVGDVNPDPQAMVWEIVGVTEISRMGATWTINHGSDGKPYNLGASDAVIRVWMPHPVNRHHADSNVRALLPVLKEIEYLSRHVFAQTISRLAGAGVQVFPDTVEFPPVEGESASANKAEGLTKALGRAMSSSLKDPGDPSALVPIIVTVPADAVDKIKDPIHYWSPFDEAAVNSRHSALTRFGVGMDLPPEVIAGMTSGARSSGGAGTGASHWTSWQIEESAIKLHIEPLLDTIGNAITIGYQRVVLNDEKAALVSDTNALRLQPDRSKEAMELAAMGKISDASLLKYNGFKPEDASTPEEEKLFLIRRLAGGSATPDQVAKALELLGVPNIPDGMGQEAVHPGTNQPQAPSLEDHPQRGYPDSASLVPMSEALVLRALERAGGRLRNQGVKPAGVPQHEVYLHTHVNGSATTLLDGAWSTLSMCCPAEVPSEKLAQVLQNYTEHLLQNGKPHSRVMLAKWLELV